MTADRLVGPIEAVWAGTRGTAAGGGGASASAGSGPARSWGGRRRIKLAVPCPVALARRWLALVPAGITVVDPMALAETDPPAPDLDRTARAAPPTPTLDLSVGAGGLIPAGRPCRPRSS